jgi:hypothetical protein
LEGKISTTSIGQRKQIQGKVMKSRGKGGVFGGSSSCVIFLRKWRRRMRSLNRWWKEGKWVGCLGYFERIEVSRIVLGA